MRVLVSAASKHGATEEIGAEIARSLSDEGFSVEVQAPAEVSSVDDFGAVVLGSAVYAGHWLGPAKDMAERLSGPLRARAVWLFSSGPVGDPPEPADDPVDIAKLMATTGARGHRVFPGRIAREGLSLPERMVVKALRVPDGDFRDWDAVRSWAAGIAAELR
ncbi:MAG: flavodoxin domain-containing protein [Actinomycetota bacterium]|jgi:menaquinone-dependent protoporphyrinogen oxidase